VAPEAIVKQARPTSDEAVRRIREESRRRIAERNRWKAFSSWCALATLASGISLAALDARAVRLQAEEAARQAVAAERVGADMDTGMEKAAAVQELERWKADESRQCRRRDFVRERFDLERLERALNRARALQALQHPADE